MKIRQQLTTTRHSAGRKNKKLYITVHQTGNTKPGANAAAHANLQSNKNVRAAAWHWQVDDKEAVQSFTHDWQLWQSGDGANGNGNLNSIAIEMCVNSDGNYNKAYKNLIKLIKKIMKDEGIPASRVVQHNHWSGKNCPAQIRGKGQWSDLKKKIEKKSVIDIILPKPKPKPKPSSGNIATDGRWGSDTTRRLQTVLGMRIKDGIISSQSNFWRKRNPGLTTGWRWVTPSAAKGSLTILEHQKLLKKRGFYKGKLDGKAGSEYFKALQRDMGTKVDGEIWDNSPAIKKLQRRLNEGKI